MDVLLQDIRYGFRQVIKHPGLAAISILALGLGLGLTATVWSINYGALLRGLPFEESNQLIYVGRTRATHDINRMGVPIHDYTEWRAAQHSFVDLAAFYDGTVNVSASGASFKCNGDKGSADCKTSLKAGDKVHVRGTLTSCSLEQASVTATEVKVQKSDDDEDEDDDD